MGKREIQPVRNNDDKHRTYSEQIKRHKRAMDGTFYYEAIMIDYALLEDRLHSMIYHMGFLKDRMAHNLDSRRRPAVVAMITACMGEKEAKQTGIGNIKGKLKIVRSVLHWARHGEQPENDAHLAALRARIRTLDLDAVEKLLDKIVDWCAYRNEVVHAMMNKNVDSLSEKLRVQADTGLKLAREVDAQVRLVKKGNRIRLSAGLPTDR